MSPNREIHCRLCGGELSAEPIIDIPGAPSGAQHYPLPEEFKDDTGIDLKLKACPTCGLYQLTNAAVPYYRDVIRPSGATRTMLEIRRRQFRELISRFDLEGKSIFECGCGKGEFLELWREFPVKAHGVENGAEAVMHARRAGLSVESGFMDSRSIRLDGAPFDAFTSFNFLEHQPDPNGMLASIAANLTSDGVGLVTVPSLEYILENGAYYELIADHLLYFSRRSLAALLNRNGFRIVHFDDVLEDTHCVFVSRVPASEHDSLRRGNIDLTRQLREFVNLGGTGPLAVWGASHQGFTLLASAGLSSVVEFIIDSAPSKQGRYSPVSHIPIVEPDILLEKNVRAVLVIAPNFAEEIHRMIREKYKLQCPVGVIRRGTLTVFTL